MRILMFLIAILILTGCDYSDRIQYYPAEVVPVVEPEPEPEEIIDVNDGFEAIKIETRHLMYMIRDNGIITAYKPPENNILTMYSPENKYIVIAYSGKIDKSKCRITATNLNTGKKSTYIPNYYLCTDYIMVFETYMWEDKGGQMEEISVTGELWSESGRVSHIPEMNFLIN